MKYRFNAEKINAAFVRLHDAWDAIFATQTDMSPEQVAERILGDMVAYNHGAKNRHRDTDIASLANALRVYQRLANRRDRDANIEAFNVAMRS